MSLCECSGGHGLGCGPGSPQGGHRQEGAVGPRALVGVGVGLCLPARVGSPASPLRVESEEMWPRPLGTLEMGQGEGRAGLLRCPAPRARGGRAVLTCGLKPVSLVSCQRRVTSGQAGEGEISNGSFSH